MTLTDDLAWAEYKAALARIAKTGARLERAQLQGSPNLPKAERAFQNALAVYESARARLTCTLPSPPVPPAYAPSPLDPNQSAA